jgi:hypothetical protein
MVTRSNEILPSRDDDLNPTIGTESSSERIEYQTRDPIHL